jgi:hypothetical protein
MAAVRMLFAIGACGALLFVAGVLHIPIIAPLALIAIAASLWFGGVPAPPPARVPTIVMSIPIVVLVLAAAILPLNDYDGRTFWMLKAKGIAHDHAIDGPFFRGEQVEAPRNDYPILMPLDAAAVMLISGSLDDRLPRFVYILAFIGFVLMVREELGAWPGALLAWIPMFAIVPEGGAMSAYSDVALAAFVGGAFFELIRAKKPWRFGVWVAFVALTKSEGLPLAIILLIAGAFVFRRIAILIAPAIAIASLVVWRMRIPRGDEENLFALFPSLPQKLDRLPPAIIGFARHLVTPAWGLFWCAAFVALAVLASRRKWRDVALCGFVIGGAFAVYLAVYTVTSWIQIDLINSSADRLLMHVVAPALYAMSRTTLRE